MVLGIVWVLFTNSFLNFFDRSSSPLCPVEDLELDKVASFRPRPSSQKKSSRREPNNIFLYVDLDANAVRDRKPWLREDAIVEGVRQAFDEYCTTMSLSSESDNTEQTLPCQFLSAYTAVVARPGCNASKADLWLEIARQTMAATSADVSEAGRTPHSDTRL